MERPLALGLGDWAASHSPSAFDEAMARRALTDTVCVALAAREHPVSGVNKNARCVGSMGRHGARAGLRRPVDCAPQVKPLIHHRPTTGAEGKFRLEYGVAAAVLDNFPGRWSFTDAAVMRPAARQLLQRVQFVGGEAGERLLDGDCEIAV
jgi:2-methylcitrate dehydratase PrpD